MTSAQSILRPNPVLSDNAELAKADAMLADAQRMAAELAERLRIALVHAHNADADVPDTLEMAQDLAQLVRDYVAEPYMSLCECGAPLSEETCRICGERLCGGDNAYGLAPVVFGRECRGEGPTWHVKGTSAGEAKVCSRHTDEEADAAGLERFEPDDWD